MDFIRAFALDQPRRKRGCFVLKDCVCPQGMLAPLIRQYMSVEWPVEAAFADE